MSSISSLQFQGQLQLRWSFRSNKLPFSTLLLDSFPVGHKHNYPNIEAEKANANHPPRFAADPISITIYRDPHHLFECPSGHFLKFNHNIECHDDLLDSSAASKIATFVRQSTGTDSCPLCHKRGRYIRVEKLSVHRCHDNASLSAVVASSFHLIGNLGVVNKNIGTIETRLVEFQIVDRCNRLLVRGKETKSQKLHRLSQFPTNANIVLVAAANLNRIERHGSRCTRLLRWRISQGRTCGGWI
jgi:hypothetical protein